MSLESLTDRRLRELEDQRDKAEAVAHILQGQLTERTRERDAARDLALVLEEDHERLVQERTDLYERLLRADSGLRNMADECSSDGVRSLQLDSKAEGVRLALSYINEYVRAEQNALTGADQ